MKNVQISKMSKYQEKSVMKKKHSYFLLQTESERVKLRSASDPLDVGVGDPEKPN